LTCNSNEYKTTTWYTEEASTPYFRPIHSKISTRNKIQTPTITTKMSKRDGRDSSVPYAALPSNPNQQNVIVLPVYYSRPNQNYRCLRRCLIFTGIVVLLSAAVFFLYPSDPTLQLVRLQLNHVRVNSSPALTLDLSFSLTIRVRNRDFFSLDYDKLVVSVGYRGRELGVVSSEGGRVRARGSSYVNATLDLNGFEVVHDVIYLIADWAKGVIPFDTNTKVDGDLGLFLFKAPIKRQKYHVRYM
ncbi:Late embryogenesis abundant hydroxyproline-rich glycoprotein family, putative isoform 2, partial [Theobroma cacao]